MKKNKNLIIVLVAIGAIASLAAFLFGTKKGKNMTKSWKRQGQKITGEVKDLIEDAKQKFESLRKEFLKEDKRKESTAEQTHQAS
jgi:hypothetical protein